MTEAERIREWEAESERLKYEASDPAWMDQEEADFWERVEAEYP